MRKKGRRLWKILLAVFLTLVLLVAAYLVYVFVDYHRIGDQRLYVKRANTRTVSAGEEYSLLSWNIGFGAYEADYDFFMDGGKQSWATSEEDLRANLAAIGRELLAQDADFLLLQEVDIGSTRTYQVDEFDLIETSLAEAPLAYTDTFAQNYDSPFLFYPFYQPHGASRSGIATFSRCNIASAERRELPVEKTLHKLLDLDRCYSVSRIPSEDGRELVLYNLHLSAYTSDGTIATEQLRLLLQDMSSEYAKGNWCVAGGDFNKDLLGDSSAVFGVPGDDYTWAQPIPTEVFDVAGLTLIAPCDPKLPVPSCRNPDSPYHPGQYVLTVDGFIVSPNVTCSASRVIDFAFAYSDHNPVRMSFVLEN